MTGLNEKDLDLLRLKFRVEVQHILLRSLYIALARIAPNGEQFLKDRFAALRQDHAKIALKNLDPAYSDMISAEYQEVLDETLSDIEDGLKSNS